jgi:hypothetical protein
VPIPAFYLIGVANNTAVAHHSMYIVRRLGNPGYQAPHFKCVWREKRGSAFTELVQHTSIPGMTTTVHFLCAPDFFLQDGLRGRCWQLESKVLSYLPSIISSSCSQSESCSEHRDPIKFNQRNLREAARSTYCMRGCVTNMQTSFVTAIFQTLVIIVS